MTWTVRTVPGTVDNMVISGRPSSQGSLYRAATVHRGVLVSALACTLSPRLHTCVLKGETYMSIFSQYLSMASGTICYRLRFVRMTQDFASFVF